ncbi:MAG: hypothetical protein K6F69_09835 [Treponema sp.]|nr:hypothetical protein [Treponema sp.]
MPSSLYHLNVAYLIAQADKSLYTPEYFLGAIAPDCVNLNGFAPKNIRWQAHNRAIDLDKWEENVYQLYKKEKYGAIDSVQFNDFLLGFVTHIFTDIQADRIEDTVRADMMQKYPDSPDEYKLYSSQIKLYEYSQLDSEWWKDTVSKLSVAHAFSVNNLKSLDVFDWRNFVLADYKQKQKTEYDLITPEIIQKVAWKVLDKISNLK